MLDNHAARVPFRFLYENPPAPGDTIEMFPGVHWLRLPLPSRLGHVNCWLLEGAEGWTIVDVGVNHPTTAEIWDKLFKGMLASKPISSIIITHGHSDHVGYLGELHKRCPDAPVAMTLAEYLVVLMRLYEPTDRLLEQGNRTVSLCGPPSSVMAEMVARRTTVRDVFSGLPQQYLRVMNGDTIHAGDRSWEVRTFGGHTSDMITLLNREDRIFIAADQVLSNITPSINVQLREPWGDPLRHFYDSFEVLLTLPDSCTVLPSHGRPFAGLHERVLQVRDHHEGRLAKVLSFVPGPVTPYEVAVKTFEKAMATPHAIQAMFETLAHLNYLEVKGKVVSSIGDDGVIYFSPAGDGAPVRRARPAVVTRE